MVSMVYFLHLKAGRSGLSAFALAAAIVCFSFSAAHPATIVEVPESNTTALIDALLLEPNDELIINLGGGTYVLSPTEDARIPFAGSGNNGLPVLNSDVPGTITIRGNGSIIERDSGLFFPANRARGWVRFSVSSK